MALKEEAEKALDKKLFAYSARFVAVIPAPVQYQSTFYSDTEKSIEDARVEFEDYLRVDIDEKLADYVSSDQIRYSVQDFTRETDRDTTEATLLAESNPEELPTPTERVLN